MRRELKHKEITHKIIGVFYEVYSELGLAFESAGVRIRSPVKIPVWFRGQRVGQFEGDMLVEDVVWLELKVARCVDRSHIAQLRNYLRATDVEVGILLNFGLKPEFKRLILENSSKTNRR